MNKVNEHRVIVWILLLSITTLFNVARADEKVTVEPKAAKVFAVMPEGIPFPEGITINPDNGDVIVSTFSFNPPHWLVRFSKKGKLIAVADLGPAPLLGLAYNPDDGMIYICTAADLAVGAGASRIQRIDAGFVDASTLEDVADVPDISAAPSAPNDLTFDSMGDLYFSDSFQGAIFKIEDPAGSCPGPGCDVDTIALDPLLTTTGFPGFGANGVTLSDDESHLFVANTGDDRILRVDLADPDAVSVFAESIDGADGVVNDGDGHLIVAANQADQVVMLDIDTGRVRAKLGEFHGIKKGAPRGLLFPASLAIAKNKIIVTNLSFPLTPELIGDEPEEDVTEFTISSIKIPKIKD
jgi:sugar lactone lactonase YvrE